MHEHRANTHVLWSAHNQKRVDQRCAEANLGFTFRARPERSLRYRNTTPRSLSTKVCPKGLNPGLAGAKVNACRSPRRPFVLGGLQTNGGSTGGGRVECFSGRAAKHKGLITS
eukprot:5368204-Pyramimonas_sp.AAC.1